MELFGYRVAVVLIDEDGDEFEVRNALSDTAGRVVLDVPRVAEAVDDCEHDEPGARRVF